MLPMSSTWCPSCFRRACKPATRRADGPMSTPRRLCPRSMGTPIILIFCPILYSFCRGNLRVYPINHARKGYHFPDVFRAANPCHGTFQTQAETRVRNAAVTAEIEITLKKLFRQIVFMQPLYQQTVIVNALAAANDFAITFGREHIKGKRKIGAR